MLTSRRFRVSCNTATTKSALGSIDASEGVTAAEGAQVIACINALNGVNILTYNGWQLAFGKDPVIGSVPDACNQNNAAAADTSSANIGPQLLAFLALISVILGLLFASAGFVGALAARSRALVTAIFAAGAGVLLVLNHFHVRDELLSKISSSEGSSVPGINPASLFNINPGTGLLVALVILLVALLYNLAALVIGNGSPAVAMTDPLVQSLDPPEHFPDPRSQSRDAPEPSPDPRSQLPDASEPPPGSPEPPPPPP